MQYFLLATSVLLGTGKNMVSKCAGDKFSGINNLFATNIITALIGIIVFGCIGFGTGIFKNALPLLIAVLYGIFTMFSQMFFIKAVEYSATAVCSLIYSMGFILPTLFSVIFFKEPFGLQKIIALALMLVAFVCVSNIKGKGVKKLYFAIFAMLTSGIIGIIQKIIPKTGADIPISQYLILAFITMLIISVIGLFITDKGSDKHKKSPDFIGLSFLMGICVAFANSINIKLAGSMPGVIFFTCLNGGTIILSAILSRILFKEKLNNLQKIGIFIGITSIVVMVI